MDAKRSLQVIVTQLCELLKAKRLDKTDLRQQVQVINDVATEVKAGRRYILFPEGGYDHNHNSLRGFLPGSFKIAQKAKCPIVPVVLYDSFKPFEGKSFRKVITQLHFLPPIPYETFADMKTYEIRDMVVSLIQNQLDKMESLNDWQGIAEEKRDSSYVISFFRGNPVRAEMLYLNFGVGAYTSVAFLQQKFQKYIVC